MIAGELIDISSNSLRDPYGTCFINEMSGVRMGKSAVDRISVGCDCIVWNVFCVSRVKQKGMVTKMKVFKGFLIVILLFIPTILAVWLYFDAQKSPVVARAVERVEMIDTAQNQITLNKENADDEESIRFLVEMIDKAEAVSTLPGDVAQTAYFETTFFSYDKETIYRYYISRDPSKAFLTDEQGNAFRIDTEMADTFLNSTLAASLYPGSVNPVLTLADEVAVPTEYEWRYALNNGEYRAVPCETTDEMRTYRLQANLAMQFNIQPDIFNVTVRDGEEIIFEDSYENISNLQLNESKTLQFHIEAQWYELEGKEGQGYATYNFMAQVNQPASFYLTYAGTEALVPGDFALLTVKNAARAEDISVTITPDINYQPVFVADGSYYRALIPFSYDLAAGTYALSCSCDGITQDLTIELTEKTFRTQNYSVDQSIVTTRRSTAALAEFDEVFTPIASSLEISSGRLFSGVFGQGVPGSNPQILTGIGVYRTINGGEKYRHQGVDYIVSEGDTITAVNAGRVIYVGETTLSGKTVVIEHGFGLKSWYCHLSNTTVSVGTEVAVGDQIGVAGSTGFTNQPCAHIGLSVFAVPVSPYRLWDAELTVPMP